MFVVPLCSCYCYLVVVKCLLLNLIFLSVSKCQYLNLFTLSYFCLYNSNSQTVDAVMNLIMSSIASC